MTAKRPDILRLIIFLFAAALPVTARAQVVDTLRGRVTTDSGAVIAGAEVIATRAPDRAFKSTVTDNNGNYEIVFENGTGDYLLHAAALGRLTARVRVTSPAANRLLTHDFQLKSSVQQLATVTVEARAEKPEREQRLGPETGESGKRVDGVTGAVAMDAQGNIAATAATVPGVSVTPFGISILGLSPVQTSTTLNGMAFPGADIPRNARTSVRVNGSTYDPARGWFSAAQVSIDLNPGFLFTSRTASLTLDVPPFQYTDRLSRDLGQRFSRVVGGIGGSGSFAVDKMNYSYAVEGSHRTSALPSLETAGADLLQHSGLARDSALRLLGLLSAAGIPLSGSTALTARKSEYASFIGRIDHSTYNFLSRTAEKQTWGLLGYAKLSRSSALGISPTAPSSNGGESSQRVLGVQGLFSTYLHNSRYLTEARSALWLKHDRTTPYLRIPGGQILVSSDFPDAPDAVGLLSFGGNNSLDQDSRDWTWETSSLTRFYTSSRSRHRVQLTADSRLDGFSRSTAFNTNGTFRYSSLADLAANSPSAFTRTLDTPRSSAREWNAFASVGDYWRKSQTLQLLYGVRIEGNRFLDHPAYNPEIERLFSVRTDRAPAGFHASPRFGFTWIRQPAGEGIRFSPIGTFNLGSPAYLRGGIGEFRGMLPASLMSQAMVRTGLPGGATYLTCLGVATPAPDWARFVLDPTTIPRQCVSGAGVPAPFADAAPSVQLFDRTYKPPRSWRGNLSYASSIRALTYTIEGVYSLNLDQPGRTDLNFDNVERFVTAGEGRPVFVGATSIVPASGLLSTVEARKSPAFGSVVSNRSDLRSVSRQATIAVSPSLESVSNWFLSMAYTLSSVRALATGFDAPTFDSPSHRSWGRGDIARHQLLVQAGKTIKRVTLTTFGRIQSGLPFTPVLGSDVNGDGMANDRAYVFDPAGTTDPALSAGLRELIARSAGSVRDCLTRQYGRAAGRNSCEGPWTASFHAQLTTQVGLGFGLGRSATVALGIDNPLGGIDQLLHGGGRLRGWGTPAFPDPVLYNVRGFDPSANRFIYEVNPRFGDTRPANSVVRSPFRLTLDVSVNIAPPLPLQQIERWIGAGRGNRPGPRLTAEEVKQRIARNVPDPYAGILEESDSLLLTAEQMQAIKAAQAAYLAGVDSIWTPVTVYLAGLGANFSAKDAAERQEQATDSVWEYTRLDLQRTLPAILSPIQLTLLPGNTRYLYTSKKRVRIRMFSY